tara:strand:+ start:392 stop:586 length:195 start_codon:yes stop_codon:yes gene_type:complete
MASSKKKGTLAGSLPERKASKHTVIGFSLTPQEHDQLDQLAVHYDATKVDIIRALIRNEVEAIS